MNTNVGLARGRCSSAPRLLIAVALIALTLLTAQSAQAGLWLHITVEPEQPRALEPVTVTVQTQRIEPSGCITDAGIESTPIVSHSEPELEVLKLRAIGPNATTTQATPTVDEGITFEVARNLDDLTSWIGTVTFPESGQWTLRVVYPEFPDDQAACYGYETTVTVLPAARMATPEVATPSS